MKRIYAILISLAVVLALAVPPVSATVVVMGNRGLAMSLAGLSTDSKPTSYAYGSTYYETDTGIPYVYTGAGWVEDRRGGPNLTNLAAVIHGATSKSIPVDADELALYDSVAATLKKLTWANLKSTTKAYFDTLYLGITSTAADTSKVNGAAVPTSKTIVGTNGSGQLVDASSASLTNNTSGTAANLSGTPTLPNGTTATTQSQADGSTKLATTAYVDTGLATKAAVRLVLTPIVSSATPDIAIGTTGAEVFFTITALAANPVFTITGTPAHGQRVNIWMKDDGTPRTLGATAFTSGNGFAAIASLPIPTTTIASTWLKLVWSWNSVDGKWDLDGVR